jgi:hypothetical protein
MNTIFKIAAGLLLAMTVLIVGCTALVAGAANHADKQMQKDHDKHAITKRQLASVHMGDTKQDVIRVLGKPSNSQHLETSDSLGERTNDCIYYNVRGSSWTDLIDYQLCFTNGHLDSKNQW